MNVFFTVFTPVYNRRDTIHRVWESLKDQTRSNFEWLIINDGSQDNIEELLLSYKEEAAFNVRIYHQENKGKHVAYNRALELAKGELFIVADSDDSFEVNAIEIFEENWRKYTNEKVSGITVLCKDEQGNTVGDLFPREGVLNQVEVFYKYYKNKVRGEHWGCLRLDVLKKYPFPLTENVKYYPESYAWEQIALEYDAIFLNIPLRTYFQDATNQLTVSFSKNQQTLRVKKTNRVWWLNTIYPRLKAYVSFGDKLKTIIYIWRLSFSLKDSFSVTYNEFKGVNNKILAILSYVPAKAYYILKK